MTREDLHRFCQLDIDFESIGLMEPGQPQLPYFCTPIGAEYVGRLGCDGVHFILLPEDERVFCVDPSMGEIGTFVLPIATEFREFLSFVLCCGNAGMLAQIFWMEEDQFLDEMESCDESSLPLDDLRQIAEEFQLQPIYPYEKVKHLQSEFRSETLVFSDEYYDMLGIERN